MNEHLIEIIKCIRLVQDNVPRCAFYEEYSCEARYPTKCDNCLFYPLRIPSSYGEQLIKVFYE